MNNINLLSSNKDKAILATLIIVIFAFISIVIPFIFAIYIPQSIIGNYFIVNSNLAFISLPILGYFIYTGIFIYYIKIDPYIITVSSYRSLSSIFLRNDYIDISHKMLGEYAFFDRPYSFNKTLMIKVKSDTKIVSKRFTLSFLGKKEQKRICAVLDKILSNNS